MSKERLSKLQKWILTECCKVTVLGERSSLKRLNNIHCDKYKENYCQYAVKARNRYNNDVEFICSWKKPTLTGPEDCQVLEFYKEDILLNYFNLEPDNQKWHMEKPQHFYGNGKNNKAYVSTGRTLESLRKKGYIYSCHCFSKTTITLSEQGKQTALKLLGLDASVIVEPVPLSEEELAANCEKLEYLRNILILGL